MGTLTLAGLASLTDFASHAATTAIVEINISRLLASVGEVVIAVLVILVARVLASSCCARRCHVALGRADVKGITLLAHG